ncbi:MAG: ABC transporter ATP-binding protein [Sarcina sp.]
MSKLISMKNGVKKFGDLECPVNALNGIDIEIEKGEFIAIMGPSGCGKSTLISIIGCMDKLTSGEYYFNDKKITKENINSLNFIRNKEIGLIFQNFALVKDFDVKDNIGLPLKIRKVNKNEIKNKVQEAAEFVGISKLLDKKVTKISGGEQQRVAIARTLAQDTDIIIADEPTGALDRTNGEQIMEILSKLNKEKNKTIIIVTHDIEIASKCDKIINMIDGKIVV